MTEVLVGSRSTDLRVPNQVDLDDDVTGTYDGFLGSRLYGSVDGDGDH